jgi:transposase
MGVFIGLDVSLNKTAVCVVDRDGVVLWQGKVPSEPGPLVARLAEWSGVIDLAGIEVCPLSEWFHRGLREAGIPVMCIETLVPRGSRARDCRVALRAPRNDSVHLDTANFRFRTLVPLHRDYDSLAGSG